MKKLLLLASIVFISNSMQGQTTVIPDPIFEQTLINQGFDTLPIDGSVLTANIDTITSFFVGIIGVSDLTGIEDFSALTQFACYGSQITSIDLTQNTGLFNLRIFGNNLTSLDLTQNTALTQLYCQNNELTSLDLTQNTDLTHLDCGGNQLTGLNVTQNTDLIELSCSYNQLTSLDLTQNSVLTDLDCNHNQFTSLDLTQNIALTNLGCNDNLLTCLNVKNGNNTSLLNFHAYANPNLTCIEVDNTSYSSTNWTIIDPQTSFSTNCPNPCLVSVKENNLINFSIYPNPTTGVINIDLGETLTNQIITLTNSLGQVVFSKRFGTTDFINLDIDTPKGIYFLQLQTEDGNVITKKIVKE